MTTPTIQQLYDSLIASFQDKFGTILNGLKSMFRTLAIIYSAQLKQSYLYAARVQKNTFPDLADTEANGGTLERFGRARIGRNPFTASAGIYDIEFTGEIGGEIKAGLIFKSSSGYNYVVESSVELIDVTGTVSIRALTTGTDAILEVGETLNATSPILDVEQSATVTEVTTAPIDEEDIEDYRDAIVQSYRIESQGGASGDYRLWSDDAQGVREVYPITSSPGIIDLFVEATIADSTDGLGTPSQTILDNVQSVVELDPDTTKSLEERGRLPIGVYQVNYTAITPIEVIVTITGYTGNVVDDKPSIESAIESYLYNIRPYVAGVDSVNSSKLYEKRLIGIVVDAISVGYDFADLTLNVDGSDVSVYQFLNGDIPYLMTLNLS